jgi:GDP-L-fucose synthase
MNILITGTNGFVGRELVDFFSTTEHTILSTCRKTLDVANEKQVDDFFQENKIDVVVHAAIKGGSRAGEDTFSDFCQNLIMFKNLSKHADKFKMMINFGSGAEFDRRYDISCSKENKLYDSYPLDYYGYSKNIIAREIHKIGNIVNMRLFGCFGISENPERFIRSAFLNIRDNKPIIVHQDKKMDFFYIEDLFKVITFYINNHSQELPKDINMTYLEKYTLSEIATQIKSLTDSPNDVMIKNKTLSTSYTGSGQKLADLHLPLLGLEKGIRKVYEHYR